MTIGDLMERGVSVLMEAGVLDPRVKWEIAVTARLGMGRLDWRWRVDEPLPEGMGEAVWNTDLARLAGGEPLAYVLGEVVFRGLRLRCDRRALIPRPETEQLVGEVIADPALAAIPDPLLADAGTGSGCIACALAWEWPRARVVALDRSPGARALAAENRDRLGLTSRVAVVGGDWLSALADRSLDGVIANPPYVATAEWERLDREVRAFEPREALDGGLDGLEAIQRVATDARRCLKPGRPLWLEIGEAHADAVAAKLQILGFQAIRIRNDWSGRPRFATARAPT